MNNAQSYYKYIDAAVIHWINIKSRSRENKKTRPLNNLLNSRTEVLKKNYDFLFTWTVQKCYLEKVSFISEG